MRGFLSGFLKLAIFFIFVFALSLPTLASPQMDHIRNLCSQTIETSETASGPQYQVLPTRMASFNGQLVTAFEIMNQGQLQLQLTVLREGQITQYQVPAFSFRRLLLTESSIWFLSQDRLLEFNLEQGKIIGAYPSFPTSYEMGLTTAPRGFSFSDGLIYIAHGELGVAIFDTKTKAHKSVVTAGMQPASMAAAVLVQDNKLYILQGAYHPKGFNGVAILDPAQGTVKTVSYPGDSGVVDPYSSSMHANNQHLVINNGGWIHTYSFSDLATGSSSIAPKWLAVSEIIHADAGDYNTFLTIPGDFILDQDQVVGCSFVNYIPKGQKRPIKEWRLFNNNL